MILHHLNYSKPELANPVSLNYTALVLGPVYRARQSTAYPLHLSCPFVFLLDYHDNCDHIDSDALMAGCLQNQISSGISLLRQLVRLGTA